VDNIEKLNGLKEKKKFVLNCNKKKICFK